MFKRLFLGLSLVALAGLAGAQDFFHRPSPLAGRTLLTLSLFEEVRTELKATPDENTKMDALVDKMGGDIQDAISSGNGDMQAIRASLEKTEAKYDVECLKVLTPDQGTRLKQLFLQFNGASAIINPDLAKELALTDDENAKLKKLHDEQDQKMMDAFQSGGGSPDEVAPTLKRIHDEFNAGIDKMLTDDQRAKLKTMEGAKFEFKKP